MTNAQRKRQIEILTDSREVVAAVSHEQASRGEKWLADQTGLAALQLDAEIIRLKKVRTL